MSEHVIPSASGLETHVKEISTYIKLSSFESSMFVFPYH